MTRLIASELLKLRRTGTAVGRDRLRGGLVVLIGLIATLTADSSRTRSSPSTCSGSPGSRRSSR